MTGATVYVVLNDDRHVLGVVSNPNRVKLHGQKGITIHERKINALPEIPEGMSVWCVHMHDNGESIRVWPVNHGFEGEFGPKHMDNSSECVVVARNKYEAVTKVMGWLEALR